MSSIHGDRLTPLGLVMLGAGLLRAAKPIVVGSIASLPSAPSAQYGAYLVSFSEKPA